MSRWIRSDVVRFNRRGINLIIRFRDVAEDGLLQLSETDPEKIEGQIRDLIDQHRPELAGCTIWAFQWDFSSAAWSALIEHGSLPVVADGMELPRSSLRWCDECHRLRTECECTTTFAATCAVCRKDFRASETSPAHDLRGQLLCVECAPGHAVQISPKCPRCQKTMEKSGLKSFSCTDCPVHVTMPEIHMKIPGSCDTCEKYPCKCQPEETIEGLLGDPIPQGSACPDCGKPRELVGGFWICRCIPERSAIEPEESIGDAQMRFFKGDSAQK